MFKNSPWKSWRTRKFSFIYCLSVGSMVILFGAAAIVIGDFDTATWMTESLKFCRFVIGTGTAIILLPSSKELIQFVKDKFSGE